MNFFEIDTEDREVLRAQVEAALEGRQINDQELDFLLLYSSDQAGSDEQVDLPPTLSGRRVFGAARLPKRYVLKIGVSLLGAGALALDAFATRGVAIGTLTLAGADLRAVVRLDEESGEICTFTSLMHVAKQSSLPISAASIAQHLRGVPCPKSHTPCTIHESLDDDTSLFLALTGLAEKRLVSVKDTMVTSIAF